MLSASAPIAASAPPSLLSLASRPLAFFGRGGLARLLVHLFIWHEIARLVRYLWRIPTFGPFIVIAIAVVLLAVLVLRRRTGSWWPRRRRGGSLNSGTGPGPRDW